MRRIAWVSSWDRACGIADYSKQLFSSVKEQAPEGLDIEILSLDEYGDRKSLLAELLKLKPDLVHFQHEYSFFGGKNPPFYWFPRLVAGARAQLPRAKLVATAHTVLLPDYRFPIRKRGAQAPIRWAANTLLLPLLRKHWEQKTWGALDAVVVHSKIQIPWIRRTGTRYVEEIPLYVPRLSENDRWKQNSDAERERTVLVFGFVSPEKGQDLAVEAFRQIQGPARLVIAGGVRREDDRSYEETLRSSIEGLGMVGKVEITGFVSSEKVSDYYKTADLILAPFRETSGSASLARALACAAPILASDLSLNREISERVPGALSYFRAGDPVDCARQIERLLTDSREIARLSQAAGRYAERFALERTGVAHLEFYKRLLDG